jgi:putative phosphoribosyl transferase
MFKNRKDAGQKLANALLKLAKQKDAIVIGLPRGGVVTAYEVAKTLQLPLDIVCPRKVGAPFNHELALGAVTETGAGYFNKDLINQLDISHEYLEKEIEKEKKVSEIRGATYRKGKPPLNLKDKVVILVDDGLATGATMKAAIQLVKSLKAKKVIVAIPVSPIETLEEVKELADEVFCLTAPSHFQAVGQFYDDFSQTEDDEVIELLSKMLLEPGESKAGNLF